MKVFPSIPETVKFIQKAHAGQFYGSDPYWTHPFHVAEISEKFFGKNRELFTACLLHDVLEDTHFTEEDLRNMGYTEKVLSAVVLCTKDKSLTYEGNITRIIASRNKIAMQTKYSDNYANFTGDKSSWDPKRAEKSNAKYAESMKRLGAALGIK